MKDNKIAELLIKLRKEKGFTQTDLADKLDISFQAVSKWERGENLPDAFLLIEIARIYGITVDEILKGECIKIDEKKGLSNRVRNLLLTLGIAFLLISPIPIFTDSRVDSSGWLIASLLTGMFGIVILVFVGLEMGRNRERTYKSKEETRIDNIVYGTCAAIFLATGLIWGLWYVGWVVFILGYVTTLILNKDE